MIVADWPCEITIFLGVTSTLCRKRDNIPICKTIQPITAGNKNTTDQRFGNTIPGNANFRYPMIAVTAISVAADIRNNGPVESRCFRNAHHCLGCVAHFGEYQTSFEFFDATNGDPANDRSTENHSSGGSESWQQ